MDVDVEDEGTEWYNGDQCWALLGKKLSKSPHIRKRFDSEGIHTATSEAQQNVEAHAESIFKSYLNLSGLDIERGFPLLRREEHKKYLFGILYHLPDGFSKLDASHPWLTYWIVHSLALLDVRLDDRTRSDVFDLLQRCYDVEGGGFGGGQYQYGHLATTYAATNTLVVMGSELMWSKVDRKTLKNFLYRMKVGDGSFFVHEGGESDIRAVYCAIVVAKILNIQAPDLFEGTVSWILQCQSYEGGFGGSPGGEAHGGYSFCAVAALYLLNALNLCDLKALLRWTVNRQMTYEGGFQGRTNKLVDSCYSFWQGATVILAQTALLGSKAPEVEKQDWLFDKQLLQEYVLLCCQDVHGGLKDKPEVNIDPYHTCYALSGMSISQSSTEHVVGDLHKNRLRQVHPAYNLPVDELSMAMKYFYGTRSSSEGPSSST